MSHINIDKTAVSSMYSEDIIAVLRNMISDELSKDDEKVNTDFVDECVNALLEIEQDRDKAFVAFVPLFTNDEFLGIVSSKKHYFRKLNRLTRAALVAAAVAATSFSVNAAVEGVTGINLIKEAGVFIQQTINRLTEHESEGIDRDFDYIDFDDDVETTQETETVTESAEVSVIPISETVTDTQSTSEQETAQSVATTDATTSEKTTEKETETKADEETTYNNDTTEKPTTQKTTQKTVKPSIDDRQPSKPGKVTLDFLEAEYENFRFDYIYGEKLTYDGLKLFAVYSDNSRKTVSLSDCDCTTSLNMNTTADYTLRVIYESCVLKIPITVRPDEETRGSEKCSNDDFDYLLTDNGAYITKYKGSSKRLDLSDIDGNKVFAVSAGVFENSDIETVYAPDVKKVFANAFKNAKSLSVASLENAEYIGDSAFEGCEGLSSANMSNNAFYLGESAYKASGIKSIKIPEKIRSVPKSLCEGCTKLETADLNSAEVVENSAFEDCTALESISGMGGVKEIGSFAFYGDESAEIDEAPSALEKVGDSGLAYCKKMNIPSLPETLREIGEYSFMYVTKLETAEIKNGIETIPAGAFWGAHIKNLTLPEGLKAIEQAAFMSTVIKEVTIPATVQRIESRGLYTLSRLTVTFEGSPDYIDDSAFYSYRYLKFFAHKDTKPIEYAEEHDIEYEIIE